MIVELFGISSFSVDNIRVAVLRGELDASTAWELADHLIGPPGSLVVVDLAGLSFIDSSGLGAIHAARRRVIEDGGNLVVCRPTPAVLRVLEITGLDMWVTEWDPAWSNDCPHEALT
ncbi:MAG TPA: STAS domain-containing protein [Acidimicrobiales bacterium]